MLKRAIDYFQDWRAQWDEARSRRVLSLTLAVLTGVLVGLIVDTLAHKLGDFVFPPPPILDIADREQLRALYHTMPIEAYWVQVLSWAIGTLSGGYTAVRMGKAGPFPAWIVGGFLLAGYGVAMLWLPNPIWLVLLCPVIVAACAWLSGRMASSTNRVIAR